MSFEVFSNSARKGHEQVVFCCDDAVGLKAIIAIHNTTLGPALGGCRMFPYESEADALRDVLRLSRGMTYKAAMAGLDLGGGKAVTIGDPKTQKNEGLMRSFGQFVGSLGGRYITAEDSGTNVFDMETIRQETKWVTGVAKYHGSGDPSPVTAWGVFHGIRACVLDTLEQDNLNGIRVGIQGVGNVGRSLTEYLVKAGAKVVVADIDEDRCAQMAEKWGASVVGVDDIWDQDVDVLAPCAMGGVVNDDTIGRITARIIAGAANNILENEERHASALNEKGILYAPDYVVNAGGLINVYTELTHAPLEKGMNDAEGIYGRLMQVFKVARDKGITTVEASNQVAEERIVTLGRLKQFQQVGELVPARRVYF